MNRVCGTPGAELKRVKLSLGTFMFYLSGQQPILCNLKRTALAVFRDVVRILLTVLHPPGTGLACHALIHPKGDTYFKLIWSRKAN